MEETGTRAGDCSLVRSVGETSAGRPINWYVEEKLASGVWREEVIPAHVVGLDRPLAVCRTSRKTNLITHHWFGDKDTFCPPQWWDMAIGSGACGLGCRGCFLMLTHRIKRDPLRHLLYDNLDDFVRSTEKWLAHPNRSERHALGVGIDRSDSLLYEGVIEHVRSIAPLFGSPEINRKGNRLLLLTKSTNTHYLAEILPAHRPYVVVSFSLNPEPIADLWEGKWPDTGKRITPSISDRLEAVKFAQDLGFEVRVRIDPILTPAGWEEHYAAFLAEIRARNIDFSTWTLGTYREMSTQLDAWRERWGLPPMEWHPSNGEMVKDGTHLHVPEEHRVELYSAIAALIHHEFSQARLGLCKETHSVRKAVKLCSAACNCIL